MEGKIITSVRFTVPHKDGTDLFFFGINYISKPEVRAFICSVDYVGKETKELSKLIDQLLSYQRPSPKMLEVAKKIKDELSKHPEIQSKLKNNG